MNKNNDNISSVREAEGATKTMWLLTLLVMALLWPANAFAAAGTLGDIVCNMGKNIKQFAPFYNALAYVVAAFIGLQGVMLLKKHAEKPDDSQIIKATAHLVGGAVLAALPAAAAVLQETLGLATTSSGSVTCAAATGSSASSLDVMMQNFVKNIYDPMFLVLEILCFILGAYLVFRGLLKGAKVGTDPKAAAPHSIIISLTTGAVLLSIAGMFPTMLETLFGDDKIKNFESIINWKEFAGSGLNTEKADRTVQHVLMFVQIVGAIAFIRGWLMIRNAVEGTGQVTVPQGLTHIIGGTMAINIGQMLYIIDKTFGTGLVK